MRGKTNNKKRYGFIIGMLAFPLVQFFIFYFLININSLTLAFKTFDVSTGKYYYDGLVNFKKFLVDMSLSFALQNATRNSLVLYLVGLFVLMPLQIFSSYYIFKKLFFSRLFYIVLFLPSILSTIVLSVMFKYFVDAGLPELLLKIGIMEENIPSFFYDTMYANQTILAYNIWLNVGAGVILYAGAMNKVPESVIEYGEMEGISFSKELWYVVIPLIFPTITVFIVTGVAAFFTNQAGLFNFYGSSAPESTYTFGYMLFIKVVGSNTATYAQYPYASAAGIVFTLIAAPLTLLIKYILEKFGPSVEY